MVLSKRGEITKDRRIHYVRNLAASHRRNATALQKVCLKENLPGLVSNASHDDLCPSSRLLQRSLNGSGFDKLVL